MNTDKSPSQFSFGYYQKVYGFERTCIPAQNSFTRDFAGEVTARSFIVFYYSSTASITFSTLNPEGQIFSIRRPTEPSRSYYCFELLSAPVSKAIMVRSENASYRDTPKSGRTASSINGLE